MKARARAMLDGIGTTIYTYTSTGQLLSEDGPFASDTVTNGYSNRLRTGLGLQQPTGEWTNGFSYDGAGRFHAITSPAGTFAYYYVGGAQNLISGIGLPNLSFITNFFDGNGRLTTNYLETSAYTILDAAIYGYNQANQRTGFTNASNIDVQYSYDNIGQLKVATSSSSTENRGYSYDAAWNLHYRTNNGVLGTFTVDTKNELTNAPSPASALTYDANGNTVTAQSGHNTYSYDDENRLIEWAHYQNSPSNPTAGDVLTEFAYDGLGRLRQRAEYVYPNPASNPFLPSPANTNWQLVSATAYIYDGKRVIEERDASNNPLVAYTRGPDLSGSLEDAGGIGGLLARSDSYSSGNFTRHNFYHADGNGNITYLETSAQGLAASYRYDPFGNLISSGGTFASANVYRFSSKEYMTNSATYYFLYRFYDPNLQRWISRDPITEPGWLLITTVGSPANAAGTSASTEIVGEDDGNLNLFAFVGNSPTTDVDIFGLKKKWGWWPPKKWPFWPKKPTWNDPDSWPIYYKKPWPTCVPITDTISVGTWSDPSPPHGRPENWIWVTIKWGK